MSILSPMNSPIPGGGAQSVSWSNGPKREKGNLRVEVVALARKREERNVKPCARASRNHETSGYPTRNKTLNESYRKLRQVVFDFHGTMEHAKNINVTIGFDQVGDAIVPEEKNPNVPIRMRVMPISHFRKLLENFRVFVNRENRSSRRRRILHRNVGVDPSQPPLGLSRPPQRCHERIRLSMSSWLTVRPASESAKPRSTIWTNASSRSNSS